MTTNYLPLAAEASIQPVSAAGAGTLAGFRQRFAAWLLDVLLLSTLAAVAAHVPGDRRTGVDQAINTIAHGHASRLPLLGVAAALFGVYVFLFQGLLSFTPGKYMCGLRVKTLSGSRCGFIGSLVRTALLPFDVLLGPVLMLTAPGHQRLGDRIAGTAVIVVRKQRRLGPRRGITLATWEERLKAGIVDFALIALLVAGSGYAARLLTRPGTLLLRPSVLDLVLIAQLVFWYLTLCEGLWAATVGKRVCGLCIVPLEGDPPFVRAALRACCYPVSLFTCGLAPLLFICFSRRRQSIGDRASACIVGRLCT